jgi:protein MYSM1
MYKDSPEKSMLNEQWRQDISESKLEKMIRSLGSRMPWVQKKLKESSDFTDSFLEKVQQNLKSW